MDQPNTAATTDGAGRAPWPVAGMLGLAIVAMIPFPGIGFVAGPILMVLVAFTLTHRRRRSVRGLALIAVLGIGLLIFVFGWGIIMGEVNALFIRPSQIRACENNLDDIQTAIATYADVHGVSPDSLDTLMAAEQIEPRTLDCWANRSHEGDIDYFYFAPTPPATEAHAHRLLVCELHPHTRPGRITKRFVLFTDEQDPQRLSEDEFAAELARPENAAFAEAFARALQSTGTDP